MDTDSSLTPQEVADMLKIAKTTVYELIKRGDLNAYRIGNKMRIELKDIEAYKNRKQETKHPSSPSIPLLSANSETAVIQIDDSSYSGFVICGQDIMLDILSRYIETHRFGTRVFRSYIGSYNGLYAMYMKGASIATAHLWDMETDSYNLPYIKRLLPGVPVVVVHLAKRMQGFYVLKGNPKNIKEWSDLARSDISIINREKGSGTRVLLDEHMKKLKISSSKINGYQRECLSHIAAASTIARGGADVSVGNEKAAMQVQGIDFIPIQQERYEMVIRKDDLDKPQVKAILEILNSDIFRYEISGIGGYDIKEMGKIVAEL
jgi:putative molybdopterin biosynthesis protein